MCFFCLLQVKPISMDIMKFFAPPWGINVRNYYSFELISMSYTYTGGFFCNSTYHIYVVYQSHKTKATHYKVLFGYLNISI